MRRHQVLNGLISEYRQAATLRNLAISVHRLTGATNIAAAIRHHARDATRPFAALGLT